nr:hypothetical protein [Tanacetum cinerariifolium]
YGAAGGVAGGRGPVPARAAIGLCRKPAGAVCGELRGRHGLRAAAPVRPVCEPRSGAAAAGAAHVTAGFAALSAPRLRPGARY